MMKRVLFSLMLLGLIALLAAAEATVTRPRTYLRSGPGAYFEIVTEIPVNTRIMTGVEEDGWFPVSYKGANGYVAVNALGGRPRKDPSMSRLTGGDAEVSVSRHGMSAGAKGFGERMTKAGKGRPADFETMVGYQLDLKTYKKFRSESRHDYDLSAEKKIPIPPVDVPDYFSFSEEIVGYALGASVARVGLVSDPRLVDYVNCLGQFIVETSDVYDRDFKFFILDIPQPNAYAFPGGLVFITRGMLSTVQNEAELACVLGHEIAHVARFHGMLEMEKRLHQIMADKAYDELDQEVQWDDEGEELASEMDSIAFATFEYLIQGRMDQYEQEADQVGMIYAARAGYDPHGLVSLLGRMQSNQSNNEHYRPEIIVKRLAWAQQDLAALKHHKDKKTVAERLHRIVPR
jgi:hypothetical protein